MNLRSLPHSSRLQGGLLPAFLLRRGNHLLPAGGMLPGFLPVRSNPCRDLTCLQR